MNYLQCVLELAGIIPAAVLALLPARKYLRRPAPAVYAEAAVFVLLFVLAGGAFILKYRYSANTLLLPCSLVFFFLYCRVTDLSIGKKAWCFFNAVMLCAFGTMYTIYVVAPKEQFNPFPIFYARSSLVCLSIDAGIILLFYHTLTVKLCYLMECPFLEKMWPFFALLPATASFLFIWGTPVNNSFVMTGRLRPIAMVFFLFVLAIILVFYHIIWKLTRHIVTQTELEDTNNLLQMEEKRYLELRSYIDQTRTLRHDFRQYVILLQHYLDEGDLEALHRSLQKYDTVLTRTQTAYCENRMIDAVVAHYMRNAQQQQTEIRLSLYLPENVPVRVSDLCVVLGNLLENALRAVAELPPEQRTIKLRAKMLTEEMIGITLENPYSGSIILDRRGIPRSTTVGGEHGIGLRSVSDTVKRYQGNLRFATENQVFHLELTMFGKKTGSTEP